MNETSYTDMIKAELQQINSSGKQTTDNKHIIRGGELLQMEVEEVPMLFADLIPRIGLVAEVGASDTGKSMLYRQMAMSIVKGSDFWDSNILADSKMSYSYQLKTTCKQQPFYFVSKIKR